MKTLHIQLEDETHRRLKLLALNGDRSMKELITVLVDKRWEGIKEGSPIPEYKQEYVAETPSAPTPEKNKSVGKPNFCKLHQMDKEYCGLMKH